jgi:uncharacterized protein YybS (DUF2232 family)
MTLSPAALARFGKATAVTVVLGLAMAYMPLGLAVIMPFLVLPVVHLVARWGMPLAVALMVVTGGLVFLLADLEMASIVFLVLLTLGVTLGQAIRRGWSFGATLISTASATVAGFVAWGVVMWQVVGVSGSQLRGALDASIDDAASFYTQMGVSQASTDTVSRQLHQFFDILPYLAPGFVVVGALLLAGCAIALTWWLLPRLKERVAVRLSLARFRMHWSAAYASIAGLALVVASRGLGDWQTGVLIAGINILLISQTLFFFQGMAIVHWYGTSRQLGRGSRGVMYVGAVLAQALLQLTGLLGLFDTWLDCRKRFAVKSPGPGPMG